MHDSHEVKFVKHAILIPAILCLLVMRAFGNSMDKAEILKAIQDMRFSLKDRLDQHPICSGEGTILNK